MMNQLMSATVLCLMSSLCAHKLKHSMPWALTHRFVYRFWKICLSRCSLVVFFWLYDIFCTTGVLHLSVTFVHIHLANLFFNHLSHSQEHSEFFFLQLNLLNVLNLFICSVGTCKVYIISDVL